MTKVELIEIIHNLDTQIEALETRYRVHYRKNEFEERDELMTNIMGLKANKATYEYMLRTMFENLY